MSKRSPVSLDVKRTYKSESHYLTTHDTYDDVLKAVREYIRYYNNYRYTERLGGLSPNEYRRAA